MQFAVYDKATGALVFGAAAAKIQYCGIWGNRGRNSTRGDPSNHVMTLWTGSNRGELTVNIEVSLCADVNSAIRHGRNGKLDP